MAWGDWDESNILGGGNTPDYPDDNSWGTNYPSDVSGGGGSGGGMDWGQLGRSVLTGMAPSLASTGFGALMGALMPGQGQRSRLIDTRNPQQMAGSQMGFSRLSALQNNPSSFGLPGDANDINTPAGRRRWDIINQSRSADAARGMFSTGGSAQRETDALNRAQAGGFEQAWGNAAQTTMGGPGMQLQTTPARPNPWAGLIAGGAAPGIQSGVANLLKMWGLS